MRKKQLFLILAFVVLCLALGLGRWSSSIAESKTNAVPEKETMDSTSLPMGGSVVMVVGNAIYFNIAIADDSSSTYPLYCWENSTVKATSITNTTSAITDGKTIYYLSDGFLYQYDTETDQSKQLRDLKKDCGNSAMKIGTNLFGTDESGIYLRIFHWKETERVVDGISLARVSPDGQQFTTLYEIPAYSNSSDCLLFEGKIYFTESKNSTGKQGLFALDLANSQIKQLTDTRIYGGEAGSFSALFLWRERIIFATRTAERSGDSPGSVNLTGGDEKIYPFSTDTFTLLGDCLYFWDQGEKKLRGFRLEDETIFDPPGAENFRFSSLTTYQGKILGYSIRNFEKTTLQLYDPETGNYELLASI